MHITPKPVNVPKREKKAYQTPTIQQVFISDTKNTIHNKEKQN
ncbi:hypothetical protein SAMN05421877_106269 [Sphingobacterium lactis]|uniref:Uncharacterized protein n=1 Tax=Sphingobacterium lactis TaxID=797291 RepID=A0A1H5Z603_9SPHI|nr:hypothetical protein SAMN05421877_106269 [Sphingobacterium lactis]